MNIFITGGLGFIGTNLAAKLLKEGHSVTIYDNKNINELCSEKQKFFKMIASDKLTILQGSILNKKMLNLSLSSNIDLVIHLASLAGVRKSVDKTKLYFENNVIGSIHLLEVMRGKNVKSIIFSSSSSVYGEAKKIPSKENSDSSSPVSSYAASKKSIEILLHTYSHLFNFKVTIFRFFTVYGRFGRKDMAPYIFSKKILSNENIHVFGDGTAKRDFTHVDDIVNGITSSIGKSYKFEIINLGSNSPISITDFISLLFSFKTNSTTQVIHQKSNTVEVSTTHADINKARKLLNWSPKKSLEKGMAEYFKHLEKTSCVE